METVQSVRPDQTVFALHGRDTGAREDNVRGWQTLHRRARLQAATSARDGALAEAGKKIPDAPFSESLCRTEESKHGCCASAGSDSDAPKIVQKAERRRVHCCD